MKNQFNTKQEVVNFLNEKNFVQSRDGKVFRIPGTYYLSHGEICEATYEPRRYKNGWAIHINYSFFPGTCFAPKSGRIESLDERIFF
jgi:hypothetical protein